MQVVACLKVEQIKPNGSIEDLAYTDESALLQKAELVTLGLVRDINYQTGLKIVIA